MVFTLFPSPHVLLIFSHLSKASKYKELYNSCTTHSCTCEEETSPFRNARGDVPRKMGMLESFGGVVN